jgi:sensor histidine kinase YesM
LITVSNSGRPSNEMPGRAAAKKPAGIGLKNTAERLETLYGADHKFALEWPLGGGCQVSVEIPFRRFAEATGAACAY